MAGSGCSQPLAERLEHGYEPHRDECPGQNSAPDLEQTQPTKSRVHGQHHPDSNRGLNAQGVPDFAR